MSTIKRISKLLILCLMVNTIGTPALHAQTLGIHTRLWNWLTQTWKDNKKSIMIGAAAVLALGGVSYVIYKKYSKRNISQPERDSVLPQPQPKSKPKPKHKPAPSHEPDQSQEYEFVDLPDQEKGKTISTDNLEDRSKKTRVEPQSKPEAKPAPSQVAPNNVPHTKMISIVSLDNLVDTSELQKLINDNDATLGINWRTFQARLKDQGTREVLIVDNKTVGFIQYWSGEESDAIKKIGTIRLLVVAKPHRNQGYATMLIEHAKKKLKAEGMEKVELQLTSQNYGKSLSTAISFYQNRGFWRVGNTDNRLLLRCQL